MAQFLSKYPHGFDDGLEVQGIPVLNTYAGNVFWVSSTTGSDNNKGTRKYPFATLAQALTKCTANNGDIVILMPSHAESITAAAGIAVATAGVQIVGLGSGTKRPTFTYSSSTAATMTVTAANVSISNCVFTTSLDQIVSGIVCSASDCFFDVEFQDGAANKEFVHDILTTAAADRLSIRLKHLGYTTGTHVVSPIKLVGCDNALIEIDFYGTSSTSVVEFATTACTNIYVKGNSYNAAGTGKVTVDTVTGSKWYQNVYDGYAGYTVQGGSSIASSSTSPSTGAGSVFYVLKNLVSSAVVTGGVDVTATSSGLIEIIDVVLNTDATGLATGTNFTLTTNNVNGAAAFFATAVSGLGANSTISTTTASVTKGNAVLESGKKIVAKCTSSSCTGSGTVDVYLVCRRLVDGATLTNA